MRTRNFYILLLLAIFFLPQKSQAQIGDVDGENTVRIMLVGDSWANFMWTYRSMTQALIQNGFADIKDNGQYTAIVSMQAETWASEGWIDLIKRRVRQLTDVDVYVIFIGGNDVVWKWRRDQPADILLPYADEMLMYTDAIIDTILSMSPNAQIVIGSYDYVNFAESMQVDWNPYYEQWEKFGFAPPKMLNEALRYFEDYRTEYYQQKNNPNIHFINNLGVLQYYGGYPTPSIYEPFGTFEPKTVPLPYGDDRYPSHPNYMSNYLDIVPDAFHLNDIGYQFIGHNMIRTFINDYLRKDFNYSFTTKGDKDGWVSQNGLAEQGNGGRIGKKDKDHYASIFTFNTSNFPEGVTIDKGSLYIARQFGESRLSESGGDKITIEMKVGHFGSGTSVKPEDYSAPADFTEVGRIVGNLNRDEYKLRVDLSPEVLEAIASAEQIQFRVKANFAKEPSKNKYYDLFGGETEDKYWAPTLDLIMSEVPTVSTGIKNAEVKPLMIYPNPASDMLNVELPNEFGQGQLKFALINSLGSVVKSWTSEKVNAAREVISLEGIPAGVYNLSITDGKLMRGANLIVHN